MPYKTKIRHVEFPKNLDEWKAIGRDANSMRSIGAALYRQIRETSPGNECLTGAAMFACTETFLQNLGYSFNPKENGYLMDGFRRAARRTGDYSTAERLPSETDAIKARLQERFPPTEKGGN